MPKDVQEACRRSYGEDALTQRLAELDQRSAQFREQLGQDIQEAEYRRKQE